MKIDIDTIFYIILSIIILIVSGLGSRRRKLAQQEKKTVPSPGQAYGEGPEQVPVPQTRKRIEDPFERLEYFLSGQPRYETLEGESLEVIEDEEETIMDEEKQISKAPGPAADRLGSNLQEARKEETARRSMRDLFGDLDEITRAVIYSEIFPRKYK